MKITLQSELQQMRERQLLQGTPQINHRSRALAERKLLE
jgi:hypothetical protein